MALREIWPHEELDFTPWLEYNLDVLADAIGLSLTPVQREKPVGAFPVDLEAENDDWSSKLKETKRRRLRPPEGRRST